MLLSSVLYQIRSASLAEFAIVARSVGLDPNAMVAEAGLPADCLREPDLMIDSLAVRDLLEACAARANVDDFGLRLAERNSLATLGPLGLLMREQPTVGEALKTLNQYASLHNNAYTLRLEHEGNLVFLRPILNAGQILTSRQVVELAVGVLYRILRVFLGENRRPKAVCFTRPVPPKRDTYRRVFGSLVQFNSEFDGIVCDKALLDVQLPHSDPVMAHYVKEYVESIASRKNTNVTGKVRELVSALIPSGRCSAVEVARELGIDRRTLHRHLVQEGESFSGIVSSTRIEMVKRFLADRDRSLSDISEMLGFSALSSFLRWFQSHFGCSATQWRNSNDREIANAPAAFRTER